MRTLRVSLAGAVMLLLVGGSGGTVAAHEEADGPLVTHVTGTVIDTDVDLSTARFGYPGGDVVHMNGATFSGTNEWDDPRLPAESRGVLNIIEYPDGDDTFLVTRSSIRLDGPDGSWVGTGVSSVYPDGSTQGQEVLVGEGAYEGLTAVLNCGTEAGCDGYIFEGEMPPEPDPVEPPAE